MLIVPNDVKCVVCKRIFCCSKCRQKHETDTHGINEITAKNNYEKCSLCKGYPTLRLELINDFDFITHLCHHHVPLHCKKCSKEFNSASDFQDVIKCLNSNQICRLEILENHLKNLKMSNVSESDQNLSDNYVTANNGNLNNDSVKLNNKSIPSTDVASHKMYLSQYKSTISMINMLEPNTSDSVLSLRNYSSILHTSLANHTIYKSNSPNDLAKNIARQTSTPMQQNAKIVETPDSVTYSCSASSSLVSHVSSICRSNSSESDTSPGTQSESNANQKGSAPNSAQQEIIAHKNVRRRSRLPLAATPLRQVMSKSIQRALRDHVIVINPANSSSNEKLASISPLDLRMSPVIKRYQANAMRLQVTPKIQIEHNDLYSQEMNQEAKTNESETNKNLGVNYVTSNYNGKILIQFSTHDTHQLAETPVGRKMIENCEGNSGQSSDIKDIWYTPDEILPNKTAAETEEIFTPVLKIANWPLKRHVTRKDSIESQELDSSKGLDNQNQINENGIQKFCSSKLWSMVSSVFRFGNSLVEQKKNSNLLPGESNENNSFDDTSKKSIENESMSASSPFVIKRCASFAGAVGNRYPNQENLQRNSDGSQPSKRRRTSTVNGPLNENSSNRYSHYRRIKGRPPISRLRETNSLQ